MRTFKFVEKDSLIQKATVHRGVWISVRWCLLNLF